MKKIGGEIFHRVFENARDPIILHDSEGRVIDANRAASAITGYSARELKKIPLSKIFSEDSWLLLRVADQNLILGERSEELAEVRLSAKDGRLSIYSLQADILEQQATGTLFQITLKDNSDRRQLEDSLHLYVQRATRAQEEERKRISMELHDQTIQELIVLSRQLDLLEIKNREADKDTPSLIKEIKSQTTNVIQNIRRMSQNMRPATLDRLGLLPALGYLTSEFTRQAGISATINTLGKQVRLAEEVELMLFRIAQEALNNVSRHAQAGRVRVEVEFQECKVLVKIIDDGKGFDFQDAWLNIAQNGKLGMIGMQERAHLINGTLSIKSEPGKGTTVIAEAPLYL